MYINLLELFSDTVLHHGNKTAVIDSKRSITFRELDLSSDILASSIRSLINGCNQPIAVLLPKCIETYIANIGIMKSGNIFMNLDIKTPSQRLNNIVSLIQPALIITDNKHYEEAVKISNNCEIININDVDFGTYKTNLNTSQYWSNIIDTDPFCIINTSGSTGTPKGVALNHLSFLDFIYRSREEFNIGEDEIMGSLSPVVFDIYVLELCLLMYRSTTIVIIPDMLGAFPIKILKILEEQKVTFIFWVPTIMVNIANMGLLDKVQLPSLKRVWFAGEVFPTKQFNIWRRSLPDTLFANLYGPIETAVDSIFYIIDRKISDSEPIPIGYAYRNTDILLLDENNNRVTKPGIEGEICVRGSSLALGYYNNPQKTAEAFVQNPLNHHYPERIYRTGDVAIINDKNEIVFKGRKDSLIKHQGYRIELGEIEHVIINTLQIVKNGCIVYDVLNKEITLYYENHNELDFGNFRKQLTEHLPKYMIPSRIIREDEMRRNTNGKIDRLHYKNLINSL